MRDLDPLSGFEPIAQHAVGARMRQPERSQREETRRGEDQADGDEDRAETIDVQGTVDYGANLRHQQIAQKTEVRREEQQDCAPPRQGVTPLPGWGRPRKG